MGPLLELLTVVGVYALGVMVIFILVGVGSLICEAMASPPVLNRIDLDELFRIMEKRRGQFHPDHHHVALIGGELFDTKQAKMIWNTRYWRYHISVWASDYLWISNETKRVFATEVVDSIGPVRKYISVFDTEEELFEYMIRVYGISSLAILQDEVIFLPGDSPEPKRLDLSQVPEINDPLNQHALADLLTH